jgi:hypothetical protein
MDKEFVTGQKREQAGTDEPFDDSGEQHGSDVKERLGTRTSSEIVLRSVPIRATNPSILVSKH